MRLLLGTVIVVWFLIALSSAVQAGSVYRNLAYCAVQPPSTGIAVPVIWAAASEQRNSTS